MKMQIKMMEVCLDGVDREKIRNKGDKVAEEVVEDGAT